MGCLPVIALPLRQCKSYFEIFPLSVRLNVQTDPLYENPKHADRLPGIFFNLHLHDPGLHDKSYGGFTFISPTSWVKRPEWEISVLVCHTSRLSTPMMKNGGLRMYFCFHLCFSEDSLSQTIHVRICAHRPLSMQTFCNCLRGEEILVSGCV